jgi:23S rRNA pseudouridine1911/1915/1917 synthase
VEFVADRAGRLDVFLVGVLGGPSRSQVARWIAEGGVEVDGKPATRAGFPLKPGSKVRVAPRERPPVRAEPADVPLDVRFEDAHLLVVNKPRGLATHPAPGFAGPTLVGALLASSVRLSPGSAPYRPGVVHRLDRATTGLLAVAKDESSHRKLAEQFSSRRAGRVYVAVAKGRPRWSSLRVTLPVGRDPKDRRRMKPGVGKTAETSFLALRPAGGGTLCLAKLATGRTHQVRVHLAAVGAPVRGDAVYAAGAWAEGPMQLHAALMRLEHPATGEPLTVYAEPPGDFVCEVAREEVEQWA